MRKVLSHATANSIGGILGSPAGGGVVNPNFAGHYSAIEHQLLRITGAVETARFRHKPAQGPAFTSWYLKGVSSCNLGSRSRDSGLLAMTIVLPLPRSVRSYR
jgi:hypothetical protein